MSRKTDPFHAELCAGKVVFDSFDLATHAAKRHRRTGKRLAYRCSGCNRWHLSGVQGLKRAGA